MTLHLTYILAKGSEEKYKMRKMRVHTVIVISKD